MLISIVLTLVSPLGGTLPAEQGRANYAELLNRLETALPGEGAALHDMPGLKPVTCSGLLGAEGENVTIRPGEPREVRVTGLTPHASAVLAEALLRRPPRAWRLGSVTFDVARVTCDARLSPWAGQTTHEALAERTLRRHDARPDLRHAITLAFDSPTAFRGDKTHMPLPLPGLVFGSLADRWNAFAAMPVDAGTRAAAEELLGVSFFRLHSRVALRKNGAVSIGGVGEVTYTAVTREVYWLAVFQMLADYALYSGVGAQIASGMGQARRVG